MMRHATLLLAMAAGLGHAAPALVTLRDSVRVDNRIVVLADIAIIEADDAALKQRLGSARLLMLGQRGQPVRLTRERIRYALDKRLPGLRDAYQLGGAPAVQLSWSGHALDGAALQAWAASALRDHLQASAPHAEFSITPYPLPPTVPLHVAPGRISHAVRQVQSGITERMHMQVDVLVDGMAALSVPVWLRLQGSQLAWRLRQDAQAGAALDADLLEQVRAPLSHQRLAGAGLEAMSTARLRRARAAGSLLLADDLEQKKAVERGAEIRVRAVRGGITVEDRALALNEAVHGARVRVLNPRTQGSYLATVVSDGLAEVK